MQVENIDLSSPIIGQHLDRNDTLTFAGTATVKAFTILARSTATNKLVPYVKGGVTAGNGIPGWILLHDSSRTGAGDMPVVVCVGKFDVGGLIIAADGGATNIDAAVVDALKDAGIYTMKINNLSVTDNQ